MKFITTLVVVLATAVFATPSEYVSYNAEFDKRCVECPNSGPGAGECCFELAACGTPGCNE
jgi:hypothetical protein